MHPAIEREPLERKQFGAPRTALLRHGLSAGHCFCARFSAERFSRGKRGAERPYPKKAVIWFGTLVRRLIRDMSGRAL
jgi:hypothetical protein